MQKTYEEVTEIGGDKVTKEQVERICRRYYWAAEHCQGKKVLEVACGTGQGLGFLQRLSKNIIATDISEKLVSEAKSHYKDRVDIRVMDAMNLDFPNTKFDTVILFEAIYYLPDATKFLTEVKKVLADNGKLLIVTANKDLYDFNPSKFSYKYYGVAELSKLLSAEGFKPKFYGDTPVDKVSLRQKIFRPLKKLAANLNLIPKTMAAKKLLKSIVFGKLVTMPKEITEGLVTYVKPKPIPGGIADTSHKVIYCEASISR